MNYSVEKLYFPRILLLAPALTGLSNGLVDEAQHEKTAVVVSETKTSKLSILGEIAYSRSNSTVCPQRPTDSFINNIQPLALVRRPILDTSYNRLPTFLEFAQAKARPSNIDLARKSPAHTLEFPHMDSILLIALSARFSIIRVSNSELKNSLQNIDASFRAYSTFISPHVTYWYKNVRIRFNYRVSIEFH